ncbi:MAG: hypothetical protein J6A83_03990 [Clostridia bacterium]|nr:hypothetical protein [Clostridia bacterium]
MLKKLLKYDSMSIWRIWWIQAVTALGLSLLGSISLRILLSGIESETFEGTLGFIYILQEFSSE